MVLHLARQRTGLTLLEIGELAGGMEYKAVSAQIRRFRTQLGHQQSLKKKACLAQSRLDHKHTLGIAHWLSAQPHRRPWMKRVV